MKPLFEGCGTTGPRNNRPVSLANAEVKIFNKIFTGVVTNFLDETGRDIPFQHAGRSRKSVMTAVADIPITAASMKHD